MKKTLLGILASLLFLITPVYAADVQTNLVGLSLFKNGLGYFIWEANFKQPKNDWIYLSSLPTPVLGTFWITSTDPNLKIETAVAFKGETPKIFNATTLQELLKANIGKKVEVKLSDDKEFSAIILDVPENRNSQEQENPSYSSAPFNTSNLAILQTEETIIALNKGDIKQIKFKDKPNYTFTQTMNQPVLKVKVNTKSDKNKLYLSYLQKGITWVPSYIVDISNEKEALFTMKALIVNDIEDLSNTKVQFITGFPHILFSGNIDPMALKETMDTFLTSLTNRGGYNRNEGLMTQQVMTNNMPGGFVSPSIIAPDYSGQEGTGEFSEDLFFYELKNISLKKGERGYLPLFSSKLKYKHIYECVIMGQTKINSYQSSYENTNDKISEDVWHSIQLTNSTKQPWTTGTAMTVNNDKILGQDLISYTPLNSETNLKITKATDIKVDAKESEIDRKQDAKRFNNYRYDLVTVKGEVNINNYKNKDIELKLTKSVTGEVSKVSNNGKVETSTENLKAINKNSVIKWTLPVKTKDTIKISYIYSVYVSQ